MSEADNKLARLEARCQELKSVNAQLKRINTALMVRVERDMDTLGSSFSLFQSAIVLESKVKERTGALTQVLGVLEHTNRELLASNEAAQAASRAKSGFLATMSHELRTPMHGVLGMTELLIDTPLTVEQREFALTIKQSGESLLAILNDILDFSKVEAGFMSAEFTPFEPLAIVERALQTLHPLISRKNLSVATHWSDCIPTMVAGDPMRFLQVLTNLLGNAVKFTEAGTIQVRATLDEEEGETVVVRIEVHDSGIGIAPEHLVGIFDPFTQSDSSIARHFGGTGLGLAIVRRLSELMGGHCGVESELARGSCFWFTCRVGRTETATRAAPKAVTLPRPCTQNGRGINVLVVEDNPVNQLVAKRSLESLGCDVQIAARGADAVELLKGAHEFALVFMDCQMPGMDGLEATRLIRQDERAAGVRVPIIALTANTIVGDREACSAAGMDDFISKPFTRADLQAVLDAWCDAPGTVTAA